MTILDLVPETGLPAGWATICLSELIGSRRQSVDPNRERDTLFELYSIPSHATRTPEIVAGSMIGSAKQYVKTGDVLISKINPRLNRTWVVGDFSQYPKIASTEWIVFPKSKSVNSQFLAYLLLDRRIRDFLAHNVSGVGGSLMRVKPDVFGRIYAGLPPINEQHRIVAKLEELLSELDAGIESFKTAREQLRVYRQALLKHAFEGKLTAAWRAENADKLESADALLARIRVERRERHAQQKREWQEAEENWLADGRNGQRPTKPARLKEPESLTAEELDKLPELPAGWAWCKVGSVAAVATGVTPLKNRTDFYVNGDIPWVTSSALNSPFVREPSGYVTRAALNQTPLKLFPPHTLLVALYGEGKTRGKCSELLIEASTNQAIAAIVQEGISKHIRGYLKLFLMKNYIDLRRRSSGGVQPNLSLGLVENLPVPICSLEEACQIQTEVDGRLSVLDQIDTQIKADLGRAEALRQSILKRAFSGRLVPQDPGDEPASVLLERIRTERAAAAGDRPARKPRRTRKPAGAAPRALELALEAKEPVE